MTFQELAARHASLPPLRSPPRINIQTAREEAQRRDERWIQEWRNALRNEQQAQQQLQQDEENEERQRLYEHRELIHRQQRLEEVSNNTSREQIEGYQAQNDIN